MKKTSLLILTALAAVLSANAAFMQNHTSTEVIELPKYAVTATRQSEAEKQVEQSLAELRGQASTDAFLNELPLIQSSVIRNTLVKLQRSAKPQRLAKS